MTIPDFPVAISNTLRGALPCQFPAMSPDLKAVGIIPSLSLITHETEECHINRGHAKLESFKVKAEVLTKTMEDLTKKKKKKEQQAIHSDSGEQIKNVHNPLVNIEQ
jgi:hypothetical protein